MSRYRIAVCDDDVETCRKTGLRGWELVEYAQRLVNQNMKYSVGNSLDSPQDAFEKGQGYCWHQTRRRSF